ncbi:MAG TPA: NADH-quinone oxidoreductase subunit C [Cyclobacteriaceae bacterium]|nr:NADH-quinone oxidoreductase subunit C [Cyclobacteriaceae bacterium]
MADSQEEKLVGIIKEKFEDQVLLVEQLYDFLTITLKKDKLTEIIQFLYDHPETKFQYLTTIAAIHYPDVDESRTISGQASTIVVDTPVSSGRIALMYQLHNLYNNQRVRLKIYLPVENPVAPTLTNIFAAANWMERETYDFYGVIFEGHPNLTRILNVDDMVIFPMRKEYPLEDQTREDKADEMFGR